MHKSTMSIIRAALAADQTIDQTTREQIVSTLTQSATSTNDLSRVIRWKELAERLGTCRLTARNTARKRGLTLAFGTGTQRSIGIFEREFSKLTGGEISQIARVEG